MRNCHAVRSEQGLARAMDFHAAPHSVVARFAAALPLPDETAAAEPVRWGVAIPSRGVMALQPRVPMEVPGNEGHGLPSLACLVEQRQGRLDGEPHWSDRSGSHESPRQAGWSHQLEAAELAAPRGRQQE